MLFLGRGGIEREACVILRCRGLLILFVVVVPVLGPEELGSGLVGEPAHGRLLSEKGLAGAVMLLGLWPRR